MVRHEYRKKQNPKAHTISVHPNITRGREDLTKQSIKCPGPENRVRVSS